MRLLARHPAVTLTAAMSSGATSAPRPLPALARIWDGAVVAARRRSPRRRRRHRVPGAAGGGVRGARRRRCSSAACRVIDLSGAFRIRSDADRQRWYPATAALPAGHGLRPAGAARTTRSATRGSSRVPAAIRRRRCWRSSRWPRPACSRGRSSSTRSPASPAPARRRASARTSPRTTAASPPTACSRIGTPRRSSRSSARPVTFVPHLVPLDRGILETIYVSLAPRHDRGAGRRRAAATRTPTRRSCG